MLSSLCEHPFKWPASSCLVDVMDRTFAGTQPHGAYAFRQKIFDIDDALIVSQYSLS